MRLCIGTYSITTGSHLLSGYAPWTALEHGFVVAIRQLFLYMRSKGAGNLLLLRIDCVANDFDGLLQCDTGLVDRQFSLTFYALFEARSSGVLNFLEHPRDRIVGRFIKSREEIRFEDLRPCAGDLAREWVA